MHPVLKVADQSQFCNNVPFELMQNNAIDLPQKQAMRALADCFSQPIVTNRTYKIILSGPFCTGKTSLLQLIELKLGIGKLIDDTTRPMRQNEQEGFPYHFISQREFTQKKEQEAYFEWVEINGNFYGVPVEQVFGSTGWTLDVLASSWPRYRDVVPNVIGFYLAPPDKELLVQRARQRGDSEQHIKERLELCKKDSPAEFEFVLAAEMTLEQKFERIKAIVAAQE